MNDASYSRKLTERECRVLNLAWDGLPHKEIAKELNISPRTIGNHIASIYNKLGVSTLVEAIRMSMEMGIIPLPSPHRHVVVHYCLECTQIVADEDVDKTHKTP